MKRLGLATLGLVITALLIVGTFFHTEPPQAIYAGRLVTDWALDLNSASAQTREQAAENIRRLQTNSIPALTALMNTPDPVLARPIQAVGERLPFRVQKWLFRLNNPKAAASKRSAGAQALRLMGTNAVPAVPALKRALFSDSTAAWHAALALANLGESGRAALIEALPQLRPAPQRFACYALSTQGAAASNAVPVLAELLIASRDRQQSEAIVRALAALGPEAVDALVRVLHEGSNAPRRVALDGLAQIGSPARAALPELLKLAQDKDPEMRTAVLDTLCAIRPLDPRVLAALVEAVRDSAVSVRARAIAKIAENPEIAGRLQAQLAALASDSRPEVREAAARLLRGPGEASSQPP